MGRLAGTVRLAALRNTVAHADAHSALAERYPRPGLTRSDCPAIKQGRPLGMFGRILSTVPRPDGGTAYGHA